MLVRLAKSVATKISYNTTVVSVATDAVKDTPSVTLADGTVLESDLVIGADGYKSIVREAVTGQSDEGVDSGHCFYTYVICHLTFVHRDLTMFHIHSYKIRFTFDCRLRTSRFSDVG